MELDNYLDKYVSLSPCHSYRPCLIKNCRVEDLRSFDDKTTDISFSSLRAAIRKLQGASLKLDTEKTAAEEDFKKFVRIIFPGRQFRRSLKRRTGFLRLVANKIKLIFGVPPPTDSELQLLSLRHAESWEEYLEFAANVDEESLESPQLKKALTSLPFPFSKFVKAAKRIVAANRKLIMFERGFISEGGIRDREWYRHLGVSPGKWLGKLDGVQSWKCRVLIVQCYRLRGDDITCVDGGHYMRQKCYPPTP